MLIIGAFKHSLELEEALAELEHNGIGEKHILAVSMDVYAHRIKKPIGELHDKHSKAIEVGIATGTASSVIGTSIGFGLKLGPIIWGLTFAFIGFIIGFGVYGYFNRRNRQSFPRKLPEVTIIVQCSEKHSNLVIEIMEKYHALTIGKSPEAS